MKHIYFYEIPTLFLLYGYAFQVCFFLEYMDTN